MPPLELTPLSQEGFHLAVPILAEFSVINRRLAQRLVGQTIATSSGEPLKIISAQMYGSGRNLILDLGVTGAVNGHLYATGQPFYDTVMESLRFKQLDFTVDTESMLVRIADRLFHDDVLFRLKAQADIDLSGPIAGLRQRLSERLTREVSPGMWLEGRVTDLQPRGIYPVPDGVEVLLVIDGSLELFVR
jgi:hypothetical protein